MFKKNIVDKCTEGVIPMSNFKISFDIFKKLIEPFTPQDEPFDIMKFFFKYTKIHPSRPEGWFELARIQAFIGLIRVARKNLLKCIELAPEYRFHAQQDKLLAPLLE
jgi:hypothetical protein